MIQPAPFSNMPSQADIDQRKKMAQALMMRGTDTSPVGHWTQALARAVQGGIGGWNQDLAARDSKARTDATTEALGQTDALKGMDPATRALVGQDPKLMQSVLGTAINRQTDPMAGLNKELKLAQINKLKRGPITEYGKQGAVFQGGDGNFYSVQFASDGTRKILPVASPDGTPLQPAKGYKAVGDTMVSTATGEASRNIGTNLRNAELQTKEGFNLAKAREEFPQETVRFETLTGNLNRMQRQTEALLKQKGLDRIVGGYLQAKTPDLTTEATNAASNLNTLKAMISGEILSSMREASKTGGAVGAVTENEWPRLEGMMANLDRTQSVEQFKRNAAEVLRYANDVKARIARAYKADLARARQAGSTLGAPVVGDVAPQFVPPEAIQELSANPTPQMKAMFDKTFGDGAADRALGGQ